MCGRFVVAEVGSELVGVLRVDLISDDLPEPSFNVAPTDRVAIVLDSAKTEPPKAEQALEAARYTIPPARLGQDSTYERERWHASAQSAARDR